MAKARNRRERGMARTSVSLPSEDYAELERIAEQHRVSVAWVVREAVTRYLTDRSPLFRVPGNVSADRGRT